jgi:hypothetical protein
MLNRANLVLLGLGLAAVAAASAEPKQCKPGSGGAVPVQNAAAAITLARQAWLSVYSNARWRKVYSPANVLRFEPYRASLDGGVWHVVGTPPPTDPGARGPEAAICASDGDTTVAGRDD